MNAFTREGSNVVADIDPFEVSLLGSLVGQVNDLLGDGSDHPDGEDSFAFWEGSFTGASLDLSDPVIARLFPDAYSDDPVAAAEHRRFTADDQRRARVADGGVVLDDLAATDNGSQPLVIGPDHLGAWLKTLNGVRLALAVRLGIEAESDHEDLERLPVRDPRSQVVALYDWLGVILESLLEATTS